MDLLITATIASDTGLVADSITNAFAINQAPSVPTNAELDALLDAVIAFYNTGPGGVDRVGVATTQPVSYWLSPTLSVAANAAVVRAYNISSDLAGTPHGSPLRSKPFTLGSPAGGATPLPSEVAFVATLETSDRASAAVETATGTRPKSRQTGRVFIGPLNSTCSTVQSGVARPAPAFADHIVNSLLKLDADIRTVSVAADLGVWSRSDAIVRPVGFVSVDDAFDTQRRRGERPTARRRVAVAEA